MKYELQLHPPGGSKPPGGFAHQAIRPQILTSEYETWREFIWQRCGLYITQSRIRFLSQRLWERMRIHQIKSYSDYYHYVSFNPNGEKEWGQLLEILLNNETSFFRHPPSFAALTDHVLPELMRQKRKDGARSIAMWSAGCSAGQEAYSLAMAGREAVDLRAWQIKISGSDVSRGSLDKARQGRYKPYEVRTMPDDYRRKYMRQSRNSQSVFHEVAESVRAMTQFGYLNLHDPDHYWIMAQDVIFCQNVMIYFKPENRVEIVRRLCQQLNPGGYLFLAPAEVVGLKLPGVQLIRLPDSLIYQRVQ